VTAEGKTGKLAEAGKRAEAGKLAEARKRAEAGKLAMFLEDLSLDRDSPVPLYFQLREFLKDRLENGTLGPGDPFPAETEISQATGLSRMTVRHALEELKAEGLLAGRRGLGTMVTEAAPRRRVESGEALQGGGASLRSFTEIFQGGGLQVGGRVLSSWMTAAPEGAKRELHLEAGARVLEVRRVRYLDGEPVSLETSYYPEGPVADCLLATDMTDRSVYEIMSRAGVFPEEAVESVELSIITPHEAEVLGAPGGVPVALCRRTTLDSSGRPIEFTQVVYRGDKQKFTARLRRADLLPG
jgi:GntR family transcriptional regulator